MSSSSSSATGSSEAFGASSSHSASETYQLLKPAEHGIRSTLKKNVSGDTFKDINKLFDILLNNNIPGPRLIRLQRDFTRAIGDGTEGIVHAASAEYDRELQLCSMLPDETLSKSAQEWRVRVIKQLRSDKGQALEHQVDSALSEVQRLCHGRLWTKWTRNGKRHLPIVGLKGWGLCLDSLEEQFVTPRLPLLILEKAECDLAMFIGDAVFKDLEFEDIRYLAADIGEGLQAVHHARIAHCDLKPQNILIFPPGNLISHNEHRSLTTLGWSAKICDFGSATDISGEFGESSSKYQGGTPDWAPPEYHGEAIVVDLRKCDIFSYGLLVWSMFLRQASSPIAKIKPQRMMDSYGRQIYFDQAKEAIAREWRKTPGVQQRSETANWSSTLELGLTGSSATHRAPTFIVRCLKFIRRGLDDFAEQVLARDVSTAVGYKTAVSVFDFGLQANQILATLSAALNDDPRLRKDSPWEPLMTKSTPITQVSPPTRTTSRPLAFVADSKKLVGGTPNCTIAQGARSASVGTTAFFYLKDWIPALQPGSLRQRTYEQFHRIFSDLVGFDPDADSLVHASQHTPGDQCLQWTTARRRKLEKLISKFSIQHSSSNNNPKDVFHFGYHRHDRIASDHALYALARIRSRFQSCCWRQIFEGHDGLFAVIDASLSYVEHYYCDEILAWAFRRKVAEDLLGYDLRAFFHFLDPNAMSRFDDDAKTIRMQLLLERNFDLGQTWAPLDMPKETDLSSCSVTTGGHQSNVLTPKSPITRKRILDYFRQKSSQGKKEPVLR
jgi:serine/threonine protein kinase